MIINTPDINLNMGGILSVSERQVNPACRYGHFMNADSEERLRRSILGDGGVWFGKYYLPWHFLYFILLPQGHFSLRLIFGVVWTKGWAEGILSFRKSILWQEGNREVQILSSRPLNSRIYRLLICPNSLFFQTKILKNSLTRKRGAQTSSIKPQSIKSKGTVCRAFCMKGT